MKTHSRTHVVLLTATLFTVGLLAAPQVQAQTAPTANPAEDPAGNPTEIDMTPQNGPATRVSVRRGEGQVKDELFGDTSQFSKGAKDVTEINLDRNAMSGLSGMGGLPSKMDFMVVHTYTYDKPGMYQITDLEAYKKRLRDGNWNCFIHVQDKSESTDICSRKAPGDNETNEMVIMTAEPKELTFIHMRGRMSLDDLQKMNGGGAGLQKREK